MKTWLVILLCLLTLKAIEANATTPPPPPPQVRTDLLNSGPCMIWVTDGTIMNANALLFIRVSDEYVQYDFGRYDVQAKTRSVEHSKREVQRILSEIEKCKGKQ